MQGALNSNATVNASSLAGWSSNRTLLGAVNLTLSSLPASTPLLFAVRPVQGASTFGAVAPASGLPLLCLTMPPVCTSVHAQFVTFTGWYKQ